MCDAGALGCDIMSTSGIVQLNEHIPRITPVITRKSLELLTLLKNVGSFATLLSVREFRRR